FLSNKLGSQQLKSKTTVLKLIPSNNFVDIVIEEGVGKIKTIRSRFAVVAAPKFVAKRLIQGIGSNQQKAMDSIEYRSYIVANVILKKNVSSVGYDLYCLSGKKPEDPTALRPSAMGFSDMIFADWAQYEKSSPKVLTCYKPFPYQGARQYLLNPFAHDKHRDNLLLDLKNYYQSIGLSQNDIAAVRMTLWGHAVPLCQAGLASSKTLELASKPIGNIYFANQDNLVSPCYETAEQSALEAAQRIIHRIQKR
ncbi:MAG: amine oxidase, partial [Bdellovibrionales bacterium]|nr:amine oxidase [Bdellovibrionales bacterium]